MRAWGNAQDFRSHLERALKAQLNAPSALGVWDAHDCLGLMPQAGMNAAPLALNTSFDRR
jgi:hypothetical protein